MKKGLGFNQPQVKKISDLFLKSEPSLTLGTETHMTQTSQEHANTAIISSYQLSKIEKNDMVRL